MTQLDKELQKSTEKSLSWLRDAIAIEMDQKGLIDTGGAVNSLEVQGNKLLGNEYIYQLDSGRPPGKFPPVDNMRDYVRRKLRIDEKRVNSVAFLVGRKIANYGTEIYQDKSKGIELDKLIEKMTERAAEDAANTAALIATKFSDIK